MIFRWCRDRDPFCSRIPRRQHDSPRPHDKGPLAIQYVEAVERRSQARLLVIPSKAAVDAMKNHAVGADRPAMLLVGSETNRTDRIPLRQRVLPFPSAVRCLCERTCRSAK